MLTPEPCGPLEVPIAQLVLPFPEALALATADKPLPPPSSG